MKPHSNIRKSTKWTGLIVTLVLLTAWLGSGWLGFFRADYRGIKCELAVSSGQLLIVWRDRFVAAPTAGLDYRFLRVFLLGKSYIWTFTGSPKGAYTTTNRGSIPIWWIAIVTGTPSVFL